MNKLLEVCREILSAAGVYIAPVESVLLERLARLVHRRGWTPMSEEEPRGKMTDWGTRETAPVMVTDGDQIDYAYGIIDTEDLDYRPMVRKIRWKLVGRDYYDLDYTPTHWMEVPGLNG